MKQSFFCFLLLCAITQPSLAQDMPGMQPLTPLEQILNPDGSVRLDGEFTGALDVSGWQMRTDPDGKPRFLRSAGLSDAFAEGIPSGLAEGGIPVYDPEDSLWDGRFGPPGMNNVVYALAVIGSDLYAGGWFITAGGVSANRIAKWNGTSWSALGSGVNSRVYALAVNGTDLYAGGYFTTAGGVSANRIAKWDGTSWSALGSGMNNDVYALAVNGTDLYAGGGFAIAGGKPSARIGQWHIPGTVGVDEKATGIPDGYMLSQNYPNPFNPATTINFDLPSASHVVLTVYNLLGQQVATVVNENLSAGSYVRMFDARGLASGVYFYRLKAGDFIDTKRMMLLK